jgi:hypothetical protein
MPEEACGQRLRSLSEQSAQLEERRLAVAAELAASEPATLDQNLLAQAHASLADGLADAPLSERKHILAKLIHRIDVRGREWSVLSFASPWFALRMRKWAVLGSNQ